MGLKLLKLFVMAILCVAIAIQYKPETLAQAQLTTGSSS